MATSRARETETLISAHFVQGKAKAIGIACAICGQHKIVPDNDQLVWDTKDEFCKHVLENHMNDKTDLDGHKIRRKNQWPDDQVAYTEFANQKEEDAWIAELKRLIENAQRD